MRAIGTRWKTVSLWPQLRDLKRLIPVLDDTDLYDGAHVAIQIVGRRLQEEKVLAIAEHIGSALSALNSG